MKRNTPMPELVKLFWLVPGFCFLLISNGRIAIPLAAWVAPVFFLKAIRKTPLLPAFLLGTASYAGSYAISWNGMVPISWLPPLIGLLWFIPIIADRFIVPRLPHFLASFVFPSAMVVIEFINALVNPMGTWSSIAYSQYGLSSILQLSSIGGTYIITFLVSWTAAVITGWWELEWNVYHCKKQLAVLAFIIIISIIWGNLRIHRISRREGTISVASVTTEEHPRQKWGELGDLVDAGEFSAAADLRHIQNEKAFDWLGLLAGTKADAVFTHEMAFSTDSKGEKVLLEEASKKAREIGTWVVFSFEVSEPELRYENRVTVFSPEGYAVSEQYKFGGAAIEGFTTVGDGEPSNFTIENSKIAVYICWDMDFPRIVRKLGKEKFDIVIVPAADWREIDPMHTRMAVFRAVENGVSMVRQTAEGLSLACDPAGTTISKLDHFTAGRLEMFSEVPAKGVWTFYSLAGDWFAWLSVLMFLLLFFKAVLKR
ncbi:MAG: hypothetical protein PQJ46_11190 [Spirochaetales bacterium]|nr:hypothetical protein [Spirochaetales bacterium]